MNPVFLLTTPRSKGSLLARILGVLEMDAALRLPDAQAKGALAEGGWSNRIGLGGWEETVATCSRLVRLFPDCHFVMLRRDDEATERSIELTWPLWVPEFGGCGFRAWKRCREMREWHEDFARMNPSRCTLLAAAAIGDPLELRTKLGYDYDLERYQREIAVNETSWRMMRQREGLERRMPEVALAEGERRPRRFARGTLPFRAEPLGLPPRRTVTDGPLYRLPIPAVARRPSVEVHTIRFGKEDWLAECAPTLDGWCRRHGFRLRIWGDNTRYPAAKFQEVDMLREFVAGESEWMMYVDADVYVHPSAPIPDFMHQPGMHVMPDPPIKKVSGMWPRWLKQHFGADAGTWIYRNAGVWACDRQAAVKMLEVISQPYVEGQQEQHQWNYWLKRAAERGMTVNYLSTNWNRFPKATGPAWFFHLAGPNKLRNLAKAAADGYLPTRPEPVPDLEMGERKFAIVYPWRPSAWGSEDLRHSLRSLHQHWRGELPPILILSNEPPEWLREGHGVEWEPATGYTDALLSGLSAAEQMLWWNDDIFLLQETGVEDFELPLRLDDLWPRMHDMLATGSRWRKHLARCIRDLHHHGIEYTWDFSTHTPYLYRRQEALETLRMFGYRFKIPFETLHYNRLGVRSRSAAGMRTSSLPGHAGARFLNYTGEAGEVLRAAIMERFSEAAPWEQEI